MTPSPKLKELLGKVYDAGREGERRQLGVKEYQRRRREFVFHMTDWLQDLEELNELYRRPQDANVEEAATSIMAILYHILPHLTTAGRLLLDDIADPFANSWPIRKRKPSKKRIVKSSRVSA